MPSKCPIPEPESIRDLGLYPVDEHVQVVINELASRDPQRATLYGMELDSVMPNDPERPEILDEIFHDVLDWLYDIGYCHDLEAGVLVIYPHGFEWPECYPDDCPDCKLSR